MALVCGCNTRAGRLMMLPALIIPILLAGVFIFGFYLTLRNRRLNRGDLGFVGLDNYVKLLQDDRFWHSLSLTLKFTITDIAIELTLATMLALALSVPLRGVKIYRALLIIPLMTPSRNRVEPSPIASTTTDSSA